MVAPFSSKEANEYQKESRRNPSSKINGSKHAFRYTSHHILRSHASILNLEENNQPITKTDTVTKRQNKNDLALSTEIASERKNKIIGIQHERLESKRKKVSPIISDFAAQATSESSKKISLRILDNTDHVSKKRHEGILKITLKSPSIETIYPIEPSRLENGSIDSTQSKTNRDRSSNNLPEVNKSTFKNDDPPSSKYEKTYISKSDDSNFVGEGFKNNIALGLECPKIPGPFSSIRQAVGFIHAVFEEQVEPGQPPEGYAPRHLSHIFTMLPSKKKYPDYYKIISQPLSLKCIREKAESETDPFTSMNQAWQLYRKMFENALVYNVPESLVYSDALMYLDLISKIEPKIKIEDHSKEHQSTMINVDSDDDQRQKSRIPSIMKIAKNSVKKESPIVTTPIHSDQIIFETDRQIKTRSALENLFDAVAADDVSTTMTILGRQLETNKNFGDSLPTLTMKPPSLDSVTKLFSILPMMEPEQEKTFPPVKWSIIHCASYFESIAIIDAIVSRCGSAVLESRDALYDSTALAWAAFGGKFSMCARLLISYGATLSVKNWMGQTPLELVPSQNLEENAWNLLLGTPTKPSFNLPLKSNISQSGNEKEAHRVSMLVEELISNILRKEHAGKLYSALLGAASWRSLATSKPSVVEFLIEAIRRCRECQKFASLRTTGLQSHGEDATDSVSRSIEAFLCSSLPLEWPLVFGNAQLSSVGRQLTNDINRSRSIIPPLTMGSSITSYSGIGQVNTQMEVRDGSNNQMSLLLRSVVPMWDTTGGIGMAPGRPSGPVISPGYIPRRLAMPGMVTNIRNSITGMNTSTGLSSQSFSNMLTAKAPAFFGLVPGGPIPMQPHFGAESIPESLSLPVRISLSDFVSSWHLFLYFDSNSKRSASIHVPHGIEIITLEIFFLPPSSKMEDGFDQCPQDTLVLLQNKTERIEPVSDNFSSSVQVDHLKKPSNFVENISSEVISMGKAINNTNNAEEKQELLLDNDHGTMCRFKVHLTHNNSFESIELFQRHPTRMEQIYLFSTLFLCTHTRGY